MAEMLLAYAENGCTVNCGKHWTKEHLKVALAWGPYISAKDRDTVAYTWQEAREKQEQGYCIIYKWKDIKNNHPLQLKLLPIAVILQKYRAFRLILDLSFGIKVSLTQMPSVNEILKERALRKSLQYIGTALP